MTRWEMEFLLYGIQVLKDFGFIMNQKKRFYFYYNQNYILKVQCSNKITFSE